MLWVISRQRPDSRDDVAMLTSIINISKTLPVSVPLDLQISCFQDFESNRAWEEQPFLLWKIKNENVHTHILQGKNWKLFTVLQHSQNTFLSPPYSEPAHCHCFPIGRKESKDHNINLSGHSNPLLLNTGSKTNKHKPPYHPGKHKYSVTVQLLWFVYTCVINLEVRLIIVTSIDVKVLKSAAKINK